MRIVYFHNLFAVFVHKRNNYVARSAPALTNWPSAALVMRSRVLYPREGLGLALDTQQPPH
jgi:hypothetical protein